MAAAVSGEQQHVPEEWTVEVENFLTESEKAVEIDKASMRVPRALINAKPEAYIPEILSLGPYHYRTLQDQAVAPYHQRLSLLSDMDFYKLKSIRDATKNDFGVIYNFFSRVSDMVPRFEWLYDWEINDNKKFGWMMTLDAFFLYQFLKNGFNLPQRETSARQRYGEFLTTTVKGIKCDIVKLENQIPLFLLIEIDSNLNLSFHLNFLHTQMSHLSCFQASHHVEDIIDYKEEHHLLGCIHKYVSFLLQIHSADDYEVRYPTYSERFMAAIDDTVAFIFGLLFPHPAKQGREDFLDKYNAKELAKAGIKFESISDKNRFKSVSGKIRFDKHSSTLFLPRIVISDKYTEVLVRNLLALEFNDIFRPPSVTQYVELMDWLIDTPEDVALLRECHVIEGYNSMIMNEYVAKMWDGMAKPVLSSGFPGSLGELKGSIRERLIKNYYKTSATANRIRDWGKELYKEYLSTPWKTIGLLAALYVVLLTTIQTFFSYKDYQTKSTQG